MYRFVLALALALSAPVFAASTSNYKAAPPGGDKVLTMPLGAAATTACVDNSAVMNGTGLGSVGINVAGTFVGTLQFKGSIDNGTTYNSIEADPQGGGATAVVSTAAPGAWFVRVPGYTQVCVYFSAYTSGTATIWLEGSNSIRPVGQKRAINCFLATSAATTSVQITGCEVSAGNSIYVTSLTVSGDTANATLTPVIVQSGTSTACTGQRSIYQCWHGAVGSCTMNFLTPIKVTNGDGLCVLDSTVGSKSATVSGFLAP